MAFSRYLLSENSSIIDAWQGPNMPRSPKTKLVPREHTVKNKEKTVFDLVVIFLLME